MTLQSEAPGQTAGRLDASAEAPARVSRAEATAQGGANGGTAAIVSMEGASRKFDDEFSAPVQAIGELLPATHGIRLLQDMMLFGWTTDPWRLTALSLIAVITLVASWTLLRRSLASA